MATKKTIEVYPQCFSSPHYEVEVWEKKADTFCIRYVGVYPSLQRAKMALNELYDALYDEATNQQMPYAYIREKANCILMRPGTYLKEWAYKYGILISESLVRNYDESNNPFWGRPKELINHQIGNSVLVLEQGEVFHGTIVELPPLKDGQLHGDWRNDCYTIRISPTVTRSFLAHHVFTE